MLKLGFKKGYDTILVNKIAKLKSLSMTNREQNDSDALEEFTAEQVSFVYISNFFVSINQIEFITLHLFWD
jgi:hypothetical protein